MLCLKYYYYAEFSLLFTVRRTPAGKPARSTSATLQTTTARVLMNNEIK